MTEKDYTKAWFKRHVDTIVLIIVLGTPLLTMYNKFDNRFAALEKDMTIVKTVLMSKGFLDPQYFAQNKGKDEKIFISKHPVTE